MRKTQSLPLLAIILSAIVLAAILALVFTAVQSRSGDNADVEPLPPPSTTVVTVGGQQITLSPNPALLVRLAPGPVVQQPTQEPAQPEQAPENPTAVPTDTPVPQQPAVAPTNTPVPQPQSVVPVIFESYVVQTGDTLFSLTQKRATSIALMAENGIADTSLVPGNTIQLPVGNPAFCPGRRPYAVGEDETAFSISRKYNISHQDLQSINGLDANFSIQAGQILCVP